ncbi:MULTISPECIES: aminotransferase class IV [unclassified Corynebacterium]|uniref:aminotransferase class IV n=1 Tax=unclassified Corynebacterium TaxID=2624378 RepID=UPI0035251209
MIRSTLRTAGSGAFNPLVSVGVGGPSVLIRPDREFHELITVDAIGHRDLRTQPTIKGPDLDWLADCLMQSRDRGADEGLLHDDAGFVIEAVYSTILVLGPGRATLIRHPRSLRSTTADGVCTLLRGSGWPVTEETRIRPRELMRSQVWLLNAFSGVRAVTGWVTERGLIPAPDAVEAGPNGMSGVSAQLWSTAIRV